MTDFVIVVVIAFFVLEIIFPGSVTGALNRCTKIGPKVIKLALIVGAVSFVFSVKSALVADIDFSSLPESFRIFLMATIFVAVLLMIFRDLDQ
jgi:hypothetical protein